jgi:DUF1365 family protein
VRCTTRTKRITIDIELRYAMRLQNLSRDVRMRAAPIEDRKIIATFAAQARLRTCAAAICSSPMPLNKPTR